MRGSVAISLWVTGIMVCFAVGAFALGESGFSAEAIGSLGFGETAYEISATADGDRIVSRLEFPLDGIYVGADARVNLGAEFAGVKNLTIGAKFLTNLSEPSEDMNDYDWLNGFLIGDTASDTEATSLLLDFYLKGTLIAQPSLLISGIFGYRHEDYAFEIYGLDGIYMPPIGDGSRAFIASDTLVLTYDMTHDWVYAGLEGEYMLNDSLVAEASFVAGIGLIEDRDDHVVRERKISEATFVSVSVKASAHVVWYITAPTAASRYYVKAGIEALSVAATGEQDQSFEDGSEGFDGIDDEIEMSFVTANAMVGCEF